MKFNKFVATATSSRLVEARRRAARVPLPSLAMASLREPGRAARPEKARTARTNAMPAPQATRHGKHGTAASGNFSNHHISMNYAICHLSVVPIRSSPSDRGEQVSQLLFGEMVECIEHKGRSWTRVRCTWDDCLGWVKSRQLAAITEQAHRHYCSHFAFCLDLLQPLLSSEHSIPVPLGARLPDFDGMKFSLLGETYFYSGQAVFPEHLTPGADRVIKIARRLLYAPYQWGGRSPFGIDAGGFTQLVFGVVGIALARMPEVQVLQGENVDFIEQAAPGDIAFFENHLGNINHTGILLPDNRVIHAFEKVRIDRIDHFGIFNTEDQRYTHRLRVVKRVMKKKVEFVMPPAEAVEAEDRQARLFE